MYDNSVRLIGFLGKDAEVKTTNHFFPPPAYGRCSQTCEAAIWNRRNADGCVRRVVLTPTRIDLPPCKAAWFAKSEGPSRLSDGREGPGTLQESGWRWISSAHL